jgi:pre-mRNA-splicing factor SYF1
MTLIRKTYDRALKAIPVTQHEKIWGSYSDWALSIPCTRVAESILTRYGKIVPSVLPELAEYLIEHN